MNITTAQMLKDVARSVFRECGLDPDIAEAIRSRLTEFDALKAEVERLKQQSDVRFYNAEFGDPRLLSEDCLTPLAKYILELKARAEKAEAALAAARPLLEQAASIHNPDHLSAGAYMMLCDVKTYAVMEAALAYRQNAGKEGKS